MSPRPRPARVVPVALALVVACGLALAARGRDAPVGRACPRGLTVDRAHAARIVRQLGATTAGRALLANRRATPLALCFGAGEGVLRESGELVLATELGDAENAAHLGHLLHHVLEPPMPALPSGDAADCEERVARALALEARAHLLELELREALAVRPPARPLPFEQGLRQAPPGERLAWLERFLRQPGPDGAPWGLAASYAHRCRERLGDDESAKAGRSRAEGAQRAGRFVPGP